METYKKIDMGDSTGLKETLETTIKINETNNLIGLLKYSATTYRKFVFIPPIIRKSVVSFGVLHMFFYAESTIAFFSLSGVYHHNKGSVGLHRNASVCMLASSQ